jgi:RNA binding exosome subunit
MPEVDTRFSSAEIDLILHATESAERVLSSIEQVLLVSQTRFNLSSLEGHYKNKIIFDKAVLSSQEANSLAQRVISLLGTVDKETLISEIQKYADEKGNLYIRLDKQRMCRGKTSLSENDAIRVRFKPIKRYKSSPDNFQNFRGLLSSTE